MLAPFLLFAYLLLALTFFAHVSISGTLTMNKKRKGLNEEQKSGKVRMLPCFLCQDRLSSLCINVLAASCRT